MHQSDDMRIVTSHLKGKSASPPRSRRFGHTHVVVFSALLPGLREIRAPFVAGFLWLTVLWLWVDLPTRREVARTGGARESLIELGDAVGRAGLLAVAALVAYLIGSLSEEARHAARRTLFRLGRRVRLRWEDRRVRRRGFVASLAVPMSARGKTSVSRYIDEALTQLAITAQRKGHSDVRTALRINPDDVVADGVHIADWEPLVPDVTREIYEDLGLMRTRLITGHPDLAAEYDRLQAESSLRYAFAFPATALFITLAVQDSPL